MQFPLDNRQNKNFEMSVWAKFTKISSHENFYLYNIQTFVSAFVIFLGSLASGADPATGMGGPKLLTDDGGSRGLAPWRELQGGSAPLRREILHFWTQFARFGAYFLPTFYWKSLDLFPIKVFFLKNYGIGLNEMKMGH